MDLNAYKGAHLLLLGKTRALPMPEFETLLRPHGITLTHRGDDASVVVEGRMMSPYHENERDRLYGTKRVAFIGIDALERALCENIQEPRLLMSLKLSNDQVRVMEYLKNPYIGDALFLKLLGLYRWQGEGFFANDANRDVTAALIERFYENIERNHNVQYANTGLVHLLSQTINSELVATLFHLEPIQKALKEGSDNATMSIVARIARHPATPQSVLEQIMVHGDMQMLTQLATRSDLSAAMQRKLADSGDERVLQRLTCNAALDEALALECLERDVYRGNIALHVRLTPALFERLKVLEPRACAGNPSVVDAMQMQLYDTGESGVCKLLAGNPALCEALQEQLLHSKDITLLKSLTCNPVLNASQLQALYENPALHSALAANANTPEPLLEQLSHSSDIEVLKALAHNPSTPVAILFQLQLDARLERAVRENPAFGAHIQTQNIGWL